MLPSPAYWGNAGDRQTATVKVTIRNAGTGTVQRVPWTLRNVTEDALLGQRTLGRLEPGPGAERTVEFRPGRAGAVKLRLRVELGGNTATARELDVTVLPQASAQTQGSAPEMETRILEHVKAKNAGANFSGGGRTGRGLVATRARRRRPPRPELRLSRAAD